MTNKNIYPVYTQIKEEPSTICKELKEDVFEYSFFNEGVSNSYTENSENYDLDNLDLAQKDDDLILRAIIFHTSHCGSTLVSRMLSQLSEVRVLSEPESVNGLLLSAILHEIEPKEVMRKLMRIIKAYCRKNTPQKYLIVKLTSWNVFNIELFQKCFPKTKWLFLDRNTDELLSSLEKNKGGFIDWWAHPVDVIRKHFIRPNVAVLNRHDYLKEMVTGHREKARMASNANALFLKYPSFIDKFSEILDHFEIVASKDDMQRATQVLDYDSKAPKEHYRHNDR
ncbi:MAG: hypothetical protein AAFX87_24050 [Bacteroidota bacterium]